MLNENKACLNAIMLGDITDVYGKHAIEKYLPGLISKYNPVIVIANAENAADGYGLNWESFNFLMKQGIDVITLGNHAKSHNDIYEIMQKNENVIAPANLYFEESYHKGYVIKKINNISIGVINLMGNSKMKVYTDNVFIKANKIASILKDKCNAIFVDIHGGDYDEKFMLASYLANKNIATAVCGTHSHVPVLDARILHDFTGFQTDIGMCGNYFWNYKNRMYMLMKRYLPTQDYKPYKKEDVTLCATLINFNAHNGKCNKIKSIVLSDNLNTYD